MSSFFRTHRRTISFILKLGVCYGVWYLLYDLWLLPDGRLDGWLSRNVASVAGGLLSGVGFEAVAQGRTVLAEGVPGVYIADGCNGLTTVGLFVGFIFAYPGDALRRWLFLPLGVLAIYLTNVGRVASMVLFQQYWPAGFDLMHGFGMTALFYAVVFGLWVLWVNYGTSGEGEAERPDAATLAAPARS